MLTRGNLLSVHNSHLASPLESQARPSLLANLGPLWSSHQKDLCTGPRTCAPTLQELFYGFYALLTKANNEQNPGSDSKRDDSSTPLPKETLKR